MAEPTTTIGDFNVTAWCGDDAVATYEGQSVENGICAAYAYTDETNTGLDVFYLLFAAAMVFFMQAGFAMLEVGLSRMKNAGAVMAKIIINLSITFIMFWAIGFSFAFRVASRLETPCDWPALAVALSLSALNASTRFSVGILNKTWVNAEVFSDASQSSVLS